MGDGWLKIRIHFYLSESFKPMAMNKPRLRNLQEKVDHQLKVAADLLWDYMQESSVQGLSYIYAIPVKPSLLSVPTPSLVSSGLY